VDGAGLGPEVAGVCVHRQFHKAALGVPHLHLRGGPKQQAGGVRGKVEGQVKAKGGCMSEQVKAGVCPARKPLQLDAVFADCPI
jgi:hypothetical protein